MLSHKQEQITQKRAEACSRFVRFMVDWAASFCRICEGHDLKKIWIIRFNALVWMHECSYCPDLCPEGQKRCTVQIFSIVDYRIRGLLLQQFLMSASFWDENTKMQRAKGPLFKERFGWAPPFDFLNTRYLQGWPSSGLIANIFIYYGLSPGWLEKTSFTCHRRKEKQERVWSSRT